MSRSGRRGVRVPRNRQHALANLNQAYSVFTETGSGELMAEDLRLAQNHLGEITGEFTSEDLLGAIFSRFCVGK